MPAMNHRIYVLIVHSEELRQPCAKLELAHLCPIEAQNHPDE
jgi:hypothetical protein